MDTRGALWPASAAAFGLAASPYITIDSYHGYRTATASGQFGPDYGTGIPKQKRSDCGSIYGVGRNRPRAICVRPTMQRVQARIRRERFGHLSAPLPGMSGRQARAGLLNSLRVHWTPRQFSMHRAQTQWTRSMRKSSRFGTITKMFST